MRREGDASAQTCVHPAQVPRGAARRTASNQRGINDSAALIINCLHSKPVPGESPALLAAVQREGTSLPVPAVPALLAALLRTPPGKPAHSHSECGGTDRPWRTKSTEHFALTAAFLKGLEAVWRLRWARHTCQCIPPRKVFRAPKLMANDSFTPYSVAFSIG